MDRWWKEACTASFFWSLRRCMRSKRHDSAPCSEMTAPLPAQRIQFERPFKSCGIDYARPLSVRDGADVCKVWLALFLSAASRAIHLEVVRSLQVDDFLLAFRRFAAPRSRPDKIISDNATFHAAAKELDIEWSYHRQVHGLADFTSDW